MVREGTTLSEDEPSVNNGFLRTGSRTSRDVSDLALFERRSDALIDGVFVCAWPGNCPIYDALMSNSSVIVRAVYESVVHLLLDMSTVQVCRFTGAVNSTAL